jgi:hypothetical protein
MGGLKKIAACTAIVLVLALNSAIAQETPEKTSSGEQAQKGHTTITGTKKESPVVEEGIKLWDKDGLEIRLAGAFEAETGYSYVYGRHATGGGSADSVLAEWHLDLDIFYEERWEAHATILWEEDDTEPIDLDEGWVRLVKSGFFIGAGKTYVPFGSFDSQFVSDPMTLEIGEMRETGLLLGYESDLLSFTFMTANGDLAKIARPQDRMELWAAALDIKPAEEIDIRFSSISNIAEGDGILAGALSFDPFYTRRVGGFHSRAHIAVDGINFIAEMVVPYERFNVNDLDADGNARGDRPYALNFETSYSFECESMGEWTIGAKLELTRQLADTPVRISGAVVGLNPSDNVGITAEYLYFVFDKKFSPALSHGYSIVVQLSLSF